MTRSRWAAIVFILGATLTNAVGAYKDHASLGWMPRRGAYSYGYRAPDARKRYAAVYRAGLEHEAIILLVSVALLLIPSSVRKTQSRPHWAALAFLLAATLANGIHTNIAYHSRGWVPPHGLLPWAPARDSIRNAWHRHVNISGIEREAAIVTLFGVAAVLLPGPPIGRRSRR